MKKSFELSLTLNISGKLKFGHTCQENEDAFELLSKEIKANTRVRQISIDNNNIGRLTYDEIVLLFSQIQKLKVIVSLDLSDNQLSKLSTKSHLFLIETLRKLKYLHRLNLVNNLLHELPIGLVNQYLNVCSFSEHHESLLHTVDVGQAFLSASKPLMKYPADLHQEKRNANLLNILSKMKSTTDVSNLNLQSTQLSTLGQNQPQWEQFCHILSKFIALKHINISNNNLNKLSTDNRDLLISSLNSCPNLLVINISQNGFSIKNTEELMSFFTKHPTFIGLITSKGTINLSQNCSQAKRKMEQEYHAALDNGNTEHALDLLYNPDNKLLSSMISANETTALERLNRQLATEETKHRLLSTISPRLARQSRGSTIHPQPSVQLGANFSKFYQAYQAVKIKEKMENFVILKFEFATIKTNTLFLTYYNTFITAFRTKHNIASQACLGRFPKHQLEIGPLIETSSHLAHHTLHLSNTIHHYTGSISKSVPYLGAVAALATERLEQNHEARESNILLNYINTPKQAHKLAKLLAHHITYAIALHNITENDNATIEKMRQNAITDVNTVFNMCIHQTIPTCEKMHTLSVLLTKQLLKNKGMTYRPHNMADLDQFSDQQAGKLNERNQK